MVRGAPGRNLCRVADVWLANPMDEKTLNLWRQIENCRRRNKAAERSRLPTPPPPRPISD